MHALECSMLWVSNMLHHCHGLFPFPILLFDKEFESHNFCQYCLFRSLIQRIYWCSKEAHENVVIFQFQFPKITRIKLDANLTLITQQQYYQIRVNVKKRNIFFSASGQPKHCSESRWTCTGCPFVMDFLVFSRLNLVHAAVSKAALTKFCSQELFFSREEMFAGPLWKHSALRKLCSMHCCTSGTQTSPSSLINTVCPPFVHHSISPSFYTS